MQFRTLGRSGLSVSAIGLGCNNFGLRLDREESRAVIHAALDAGITLFDTADVYGNQGGSETLMGEIFGERRKDIVLATKFGMPMGAGDRMKGASRDYIVRAAEASLKRLKTDWIDLYQLHKADPATPIDETLRALDDLQRAGKVRYVGSSNMTPAETVEAHWTARKLGIEGFVSTQAEYSLMTRGIEAEHQRYLERYGIGLLPFFPLANGFLSGKYKRGMDLPAGSRLATPNAPWLERESKRLLSDDYFDRVEALEAFAGERGRTILELAFGWLLSRGFVSSVIAGASRPEQVTANVAAAGWTLTAEELAAIDAIR